MAKPKPKRPTGPEHEKFWTKAYGRWFGPMRDGNGNAVAPKPEYLIEMSCFMACMGWSEHKPPPESPGEHIEVEGEIEVDASGEQVVKARKIHTGAEHHFMRLADCFFSDPQGIFFFQWNPFAVQMLKDKIRCLRYAVAGCASSGKTEFGVVWVVLNYLCSPFNTKVLVSTTTKSAGAGKVWGSVEEAWQQVQRCLRLINQPMPGKLLSSQYKIVYLVDGVRSQKAGLELVAAAESQEDESTEKVQGYKRGRVFALIDEFATTSKGLWETIKGNLFANPILDFYGSFNPDSYYDVAGRFSKPADPKGWESVNEETGFWKSVEGWVRHLDGEKSPNVIAGFEKWRGLLTLTKLQMKIDEAGGRNTKKFWQFVKGWWSPTGTLDSIYTESEIIKYQADHQVLEWDSPPVPCAGFDPSYTHGGDLAILIFGLCGVVTSPITRTRKKILQLTECLVLAENVKDTDPRLEQMVTQLIAECRKRNVHPKHLAVDASGAGLVLCPNIANRWSNDFLRTQFGGKASDMPVSVDEPAKASDKYANLVTELWMAGKPLIRTGQFKFHGPWVPDLVTEMVSRTYSERNALSPKLRVESKEDMKARTGGKSPDKADAAFLCLHVAKQRLGLSSMEKPSKVEQNQIRLSPVHSYLTGQRQKQQPAFDWGPSLKF